MKVQDLLEESKVIQLSLKNDKAADDFFEIQDRDDKEEITAKEAKKLKLVHKYTGYPPEGYGGFGLKLLFSKNGEIWTQSLNPGYGHWLTSLGMKEKDLMKYFKKDE